MIIAVKKALKNCWLETVGLFDTKRNLRVQKGREAQEREKREREKSEVDLELDFLAPFLVKYGDTDKMTRQQALQVIQKQT